MSGGRRRVEAVNRMRSGRGGTWRLFALLVAFAVCHWVELARAEVPSGLRTRLEYSAPASCPAEARFLELLAQHSAVVVDRAAPIVLRVEVTKDQRRHRGRVTLLTSEEEGAREVVADRCEDVVRGLALFSAIALDAWFERPTKGEEGASAQPPSDVEAAPPPAPRLARRPPAPKVEPPAPRSASRQLGFGAGLGQHGATTTRVVRYVGAVGELELPWTVRPTLRLTGAVGVAIPETYRDGTLSFVMMWSRLDICPAWADLGRHVRASVCPAGEVGIQRAALEGAAVGRSDVRPWTAVGGLGRLRASVADRLDLVASAGILVPLLPFDFRTRAGVAYSIAAVAPVVELDLVVPLF